MTTAKAVARAIVSVFLGLLAISLLVEPIEFLLVWLANGERVSDPEVYFEIRNRPLFLAAKLLYNLVGGAAGGWVAGRIAGSRPSLHCLALASVQAAALVWAMNDPTFGDLTPWWAWILIVVSTSVGILGAAAWWGRTS